MISQVSVRSCAQVPQATRLGIYKWFGECSKNSGHVLVCPSFCFAPGSPTCPPNIDMGPLARDMWVARAHSCLCPGFQLTCNKWRTYQAFLLLFHLTKLPVKSPTSLPSIACPPKSQLQASRANRPFLFTCHQDSHMQ